jgi:D-beta-D-heptose 7-phosphate kinase / D-beta-D-heptose 1-phosphate adenosyltransferase
MNLACTEDEYPVLKHSFKFAVKCASVAAGVVVGAPGTAVITNWAYQAALAEFNVIPPDKSAELETIVAVVDNAKKNGELIVFTPGCFDNLHPGHVHLLQAARQKGDVLIVGLNSDASVKRLKGDKRPLIPCVQRIKMLEALSCVDLIVVFDEDTPEKLIRIIKPDLLVKGYEYYTENLSQLPGAQFVIENGRGVLFVKMLEGYSTTKLEAKKLE